MRHMTINQIDSRRRLSADQQEWLSLRCELWPHLSKTEHRKEITQLISDRKNFAAFLCRTQSGVAVGFAEVSLRRDYVNGCGPGPVAFLEGIFVGDDHRRQAVASSLCAAVVDWARTRRCRKLASEVEVSNLVSQRVHRKLGFEETERVVFYRKSI